MNKNKTKEIPNNFNDVFKIKNFTDTTADIYFYGDIVGSEWYAWKEEDQYPTQVKEFLDEVQGKNLNIYVNSGGGDVFGGMAIYSMLKRHTGHKTVHIDGLAGSIASVIALAGDTIKMPSNAFFMIHKPMISFWGSYNSYELHEYITVLDRIQSGIENVYEQHIRECVSMDTIRTFMNEATWFTGKEASEYFNIELTDSLDAVACTSKLLELPNTPNNLVQAKSEHNNYNSKAIAQAKLNLLNLKNKEIQ